LICFGNLLKQVNAAKNMSQQVQIIWLLFILAFLPVGCTSSHTAKLDVSCRLAEVEQGVSVFRVSINGKEFDYRSPTGLIEFYENTRGNILKIRVNSEDSRGTYAGTEIDHYYCIGDKGQVTYLGNLKESWYEGENLIRVNMNEFKSLAVH